MADRALADIGDDFHVGVRVRGKAGLGLDGVVVANPDRAPIHAGWIAVAGKREMVASREPIRIEPAEAVEGALFNHALSYGAGGARKSIDEADARGSISRWREHPMKRLLIVAAAIALAACGQPAQETTTVEPAAPADLFTEVSGLSAADQPVRGYTDLVAYQTAHPELEPKCTSVRATEARGVIPAGVPDTSIYNQLEGAFVVSVQCGPQLTQTRMDPREHWLVAYVPGATDVTVLSCAQADGRDACPRIIPVEAAAATTTTAPAPQ